MKKLLTLVISAFLVSLPLSVAHAEGLTLSQAKEKGWVGERPDGLVGAVYTADKLPEVQELIKNINEGRLKVYKEMADKERTTVEQIQSIAGMKIYEMEPPGSYIQYNGAWTVKKARPE